MDGLSDDPLAYAPPAATEIRLVCLVQRSWTNTSELPPPGGGTGLSPGARLLASESNVTYRPSPLMAGERDSSLPWAPLLVTEIRVVRRVHLSCRNTSVRPLVSPGTRFDASEANVTYRPSALITGWLETRLAFAPVLATETCVVRRVQRSKT